MLDLITNFTIEELVELKAQIDEHIHSYKDAYLYICRVHSYGRHWNEYIGNVYTLQELCYRYSGDEGIVDVYSTNPNLSIENYSTVMFIESQEDYDKWHKREQLKQYIVNAEEALNKWENRENVPFLERPLFEPTYTQSDIEEMKAELAKTESTFTPPRNYLRIEK
jgi:hypothetical protein